VSYRTATLLFSHHIFMQHRLQAKTFQSYTKGDQNVLAPFALATAIATNIAISASLVFVFSRSKTGFNKTNQLLNTLIFYAIQVGIITVLSEIAVLILVCDHNLCNLWRVSKSS
jgi:hypothetical protein